MKLPLVGLTLLNLAPLSPARADDIFRLTVLDKASYACKRADSNPNTARFTQSRAFELAFSRSQNAVLIDQGAISIGNRVDPLTFDKTLSVLPTEKPDFVFFSTVDNMLLDGQKVELNFTPAHGYEEPYVEVSHRKADGYSERDVFDCNPLEIKKSTLESHIKRFACSLKDPVDGQKLGMSFSLRFLEQAVLLNYEDPSGVEPLRLSPKKTIVDQINENNKLSLVQDGHGRAQLEIVGHNDDSDQIVTLTLDADAGYAHGNIRAADGETVKVNSQVDCTIQ